MKPLLDQHQSFSIFIMWFALIILTNIPKSLRADENNINQQCSSYLSCGSAINLTYPFWGQWNGSNRPKSCGHPNLELECEGGFPKFTVDSVKYRILSWDLVARNLTVARDDYWGGVSLCSSEDKNNSTFDQTVLEIDEENSVMATLLYNCSSTPSNPFAPLQGCSDSTAAAAVYFAEQGTGMGIAYGTSCRSVVVVPISKVEAEAIDSIPNFSLSLGVMEGALQAGFELKLRAQYYDDCNTCDTSGGMCGTDTDGQFTCFCNDGRSHKISCSGSSSNKVGIVAGAVGGIAALAVVLGCLCFVARRRRKNVEQSRSKDTFTLPSSTTPATSTTNLSQSDSSFASSKSDPMPRSFYFGVQVFTIQELEEATKNFDSSRELGEGGFGTVYKGILQDGRVVAVKRHYESNFKRVGQFMNEVEILARLRHKNLVTLFGCTSRHSRELLLVYEYIPNGTLADHLHGRSSKSTLLPWVARFNIAMETAEALAYLHGKDVIHRDVKSNNILLTDKFQVKVADFGLSRLFPNDVTHVSTAPQGTPGYVDPEYYQNYQLTDKSDVYSFGVVLIELISSLQAVDITRHRNDVNLANMAVNKIQNQELHELVDPYLGFAKDNAIRRMAIAVAELAFRCLQQEKDMRPSMDEVLETLKEIKSDEFSAQGTETCVDVKTEETVPLKKVPLPISPDSVTDNWVSGSSASSYS